MNMSQMQRQAFNARARHQWDAAATGWDAHTPQLRDWLRGATDAMTALAGVRRGTAVLDVAAGAGDQTLDLAERVGPSGKVLATDLSPALVALAQARVQNAGHDQVHCRVAHGEDLQVEPGIFDAVVCRLGLMLFADPLQGLREMHRAQRPGGAMCSVVFAGPEHNPAVAILMASALRHAGRTAGDPFVPGSLFSLGRHGLLDTLMQEAGFRDAATTAIDAPFRLPSVDAYLGFVRSSASPILQILADLDGDAARVAWDDIRQQLRAFDTPRGWEAPHELLLATARKP